MDRIDNFSLMLLLKLKVKLAKHLDFLIYQECDLLLFFFKCFDSILHILSGIQICNPKSFMSESVLVGVTI